MDHLRFLAIEYFRLVQVKRYVLKKVTSRAGETSTFGPGFASHKPGRQKQVSKTQAFSMFFLADRNASSRRASPEDLKNKKSLVFLENRNVFIRKSSKLTVFN